MKQKLILTEKEEQIILNLRSKPIDESKIPKKEFIKFKKIFTKLVNTGVSKKVSIQIDIDAYLYWDYNVSTAGGGAAFDSESIVYSITENDVAKEVNKIIKDDLKNLNLEIKEFINSWKSLCKKYKTDYKKEFVFLAASC